MRIPPVSTVWRGLVTGDRSSKSGSMSVSTYDKWTLGDAGEQGFGRGAVSSQTSIPGRSRRSAGSSMKVFEEGASIALVARRHDLNANQLFTWRRQFGVGGFEPKSLAPILPVTIAPATVAEDSRPGGQMEIVLAQGDRIIVGADVEAVALARVLKALAQR